MLRPADLQREAAATGFRGEVIGLSTPFRTFFCD